MTRHGEVWHEDWTRPSAARTAVEEHLVRVFGMDGPGDDEPEVDEDIRSGFVILAGVAGFVLFVVGVVLCLVAYGVTHP